MSECMYSVIHQRGVFYMKDNKTLKIAVTGLMAALAYIASHSYRSRFQHQEELLHSI